MECTSTRIAAKSINQSSVMPSNKLEKSRRLQLAEDQKGTSPAVRTSSLKTPCDDGDGSGSESRSDFQEEDFVCVPLSNLNKDAVTFNTKD